MPRRKIVKPEVVEQMHKALLACRDLFAKNHCIDHMNWGESFLSAENIRELNETPGIILHALKAYADE